MKKTLAVLGCGLLAIIVFGQRENSTVNYGSAATSSRKSTVKKIGSSSDTYQLLATTNGGSNEKIYASGLRKSDCEQRRDELRFVAEGLSALGDTGKYYCLSETLLNN